MTEEIYQCSGKKEDVSALWGSKGMSGRKGFPELFFLQPQHSELYQIGYDDQSGLFICGCFDLIELSSSDGLSKKKICGIWGKCAKVA